MHCAVVRCSRVLLCSTTVVIGGKAYTTVGGIIACNPSQCTSSDDALLIQSLDVACTKDCTNSAGTQCTCTITPECGGTGGSTPAPGLCACLGVWAAD